MKPPKKDDDQQPWLLEEMKPDPLALQAAMGTSEAILGAL
jgi:hypothetical protein